MISLLKAIGKSLQVIIDGVEYSDVNTIELRINGEQVSTFSHSHNIEVEIKGDVDTLSTVSGDVEVDGNVNNLQTTSGDVEVNGSTGSVQTVSGDVAIYESSPNVTVKTVSGDVQIG